MRAADALAALATAYADPAGIVARLRAEGRRVIRVLGSDAPTPLVAAAGFVPVRLAAGAASETPAADAVMGQATMSVRGRRLLEQLLDPAHADVPVLITRADAEQPQIFAALRERLRLGEPAPRAIHLLDLLHTDRAASREYSLARLAQLTAWLGDPDEDAVATAEEAAAATAALLTQLDELRRAGQLAGIDMLRSIGAASVLPAYEFEALAQAVLGEAGTLPKRAGERVFVSGSAHESDAIYVAIERAGALIVGEDHAWGTAQTKPWQQRIPLAAQCGHERAAALVGQLAATGAERVIHVSIAGDEAAPWDVPAIRSACEQAGVPFSALRTPLDPGPDFAEALAGRAPSRAKPAAPKPTAAKPTERSRKSLASVAAFSAYQRDWFASVRQAVADGSPFAVVNANAPQEILRALGIPFVVNQWWASIVAAKQQSGRYRTLLRGAGFPTDVEAYSAQGIAASLDEDAEQAPWGGLPKPDFLHAIASSDPTARIFEEWAGLTGADRYIYERTADPRLDLPIRWWDDLPDRWDEVLEPERLDLLVAEIAEVVARLKAATGRTLDPARLIEVMDLVNEQEGYYRRTRDLIARTVPAPIGIVDSMPATMVPQWHRGTEWARDAAKAFYDEVADRVAAGAAAVSNERIRLMWVGRGLWSDMAFYQRWEESHGAVFVWSMYLALAADGYIRHHDRGRDPLRALAARFLTMGDELRMPSWAGPWHVHEAQTHAVDAVIAADDADPFVLRALAAAGVPVLELGVDNYALDEAGKDALDARITAFIEGSASERADARMKVAA